MATFYKKTSVGDDKTVSGQPTSELLSTCHCHSLDIRGRLVGANTFAVVSAFAVSKGTYRFGGFVLGGLQKRRDNEGVRQQRYHQLTAIFICSGKTKNQNVVCGNCQTGPQM